MRRDFSAAGLSQYPPGPHLKAWPQQVPPTDDAPAEVPSTNDASGADTPWTVELSSDAPTIVAARPELLLSSPRKGFGFFPDDYVTTRPVRISRSRGWQPSAWTSPRRS